LFRGFAVGIPGASEKRSDLPFFSTSWGARNFFAVLFVPCSVRSLCRYGQIDANSHAGGRALQMISRCGRGSYHAAPGEITRELALVPELNYVCIHPLDVS